MKASFLPVRPKYSLRIALLLFAGIHLSADAQQLLNPRFSRYTINEGLSQSLVYSITQDHQGFMWFGTKDGLNRFDGYDFTIYRHDPFDSTSLSDNTITTLFSDSKGRLWVGTMNRGLNLYNRGQNSFLHLDHPILSHANIHAMTEDSLGHIWIATYGDGLFQLIFDLQKGRLPQKINQYTHQPGDSKSLHGNIIIDVFADRKGILWVSTTAGRIQYANPGQGAIRFHSPEYTIKNISKKIIPGGLQYEISKYQSENSGFQFHGGWFTEDHRGRLWIGMPGGLCLLDQSNHELLFFDPTMPGLEKGMVRSISRINTGNKDNENFLWLGFFDGLGIFNTNTYFLKLIKNDPGNSKSLLPGVVLCMYQDKSGCIWVGSNGYGLSQYAARSTRFYLPQYHTADGRVSTKNLSIRCFFDTPQYVLIGATNGLWKANKATRLMYKVPLEQAPGTFNLMFHIVSAEQDNVWIATSSGLVHYKPGSDQSKIFYPDVSRNGQTDNRIFKLYNDGSGHVWCLTAYTFSAFDIKHKTFTHYFYNHKRINEFSEPAYGDISRDTKGNYWLGTTEGLLYFDLARKKFSYYVNIPSDTSSLSLNVVRCVTPDPQQPDKYLWVGTAGGGLNQLNLLTHRFNHFTTDDGLPNNVVYGILPDKLGGLWMSTNNGLSRLDPSAGNFMNYTVQSGLQSNEFNSGAFYKNSQGKLLFGGINGFNAFYPDHIIRDTFIPPVIFTGLRLSNNMVTIQDQNSFLEMPIWETREITLPYKENNIGLKIAGLDYSGHGNLQYAFKLKGIDDDWVSMGTNRTITFSDMDPGNYELQVKAANSSGTWSNQFTTLRIIITAPWWESWWAYSLYITILLAILYFIRMYELKRIRLENNLKLKYVETDKLKELDHFKSRFFANISHEFRTPITLLMGPLDDVMQGGDPKELITLVPEMHRNSKRLMQLINQLLDLSRLDTGNYVINTTSEDIIPFVGQMVNSFSSLADRKNITLKNNVDSTLRKILDSGRGHFYFDADIMEKIVTNLLSNAFKFTPNGGAIFVGLGLHENKTAFLELKVEDNGIGISTEKKNHIFDRFYQADHSSKRRNEGSGIGLSLVKELVELHKGQISVQSELDEGSIFTCLFPFNQKIGADNPEVRKNTTETQEIGLPVEGNDPRQMDPNRPSIEKPLILVVEDHRDVRKYIVEKLADKYRVSEAGNGVEGLEIAVQEIPDLVISDVMMPEMDGFELCRILKTDDRTCHIPVILLTARAEDTDKISGLETGADAYLIKPFNSRELLVRVQKLMELRNRLRSKFSGHLIVRPHEITVTSRDRDFMQILLSVVEEHLDDVNFSVEDLGKGVHMSRSQISRKLKAIIDHSPQQFIQSVRMERAMELLKKDAGTIAEISYRVGYDDPGYFTRVFKKHFGFLPSERENFPD